jgi:hypothetical protein
VRKNGKGKEAENRPGSGLREEEGVDDEVRSPVSVVGPGHPIVGDADAQAVEDPVTPPVDVQDEEERGE